MASKIEWTGDTWNPIRARRKDTGKVGWHCEKVSNGCKHCYASTFNNRNLPGGGTCLPYTPASREKVEIFVDEKTLTAPLRRKKPQTYFVCSMTDLFGEFVDFELIDRVFAVMALCPQHTFQVLTKRPERMAEYLNFSREGNGPDRGSDRCLMVAQAYYGDIRHALLRGGQLADLNMGLRDRWPLPNVWLGTSIENQQASDERIPHLLKCPAAMLFLSVEPLLGAVDLNDALSFSAIQRALMVGYTKATRIRDRLWVIVGGESGPKARSCDIEHVRMIVKWCKDASVPVFVKQLGSNPNGFYGWPDWRREPDHHDGRDCWSLSDPWGRTRADVCGGKWHTWDQQGTGGENYSDSDSLIARRSACAALLRQGWAPMKLRSSKGGDPSEWPDDLKVREMPCVETAVAS